MSLFDFFKKDKVELTDKQLKHNKMWEMWADEQTKPPYTELMTYQSEVNNGGHAQYFSNTDDESDLQKEISVLDSVLSEKLKNNLHEAYNAYLILEEKYDEYAEKTIERCDDAFFENEEQINNILDEYESELKI